jgi:hypothetical protein
MDNFSHVFRDGWSMNCDSYMSLDIDDRQTNEYHYDCLGVLADHTVDRRLLHRYDNDIRVVYSYVCAHEHLIRTDGNKLCRKIHTDVSGCHDGGSGDDSGSSTYRMIFHILYKGAPFLLVEVQMVRVYQNL